LRKYDAILEQLRTDLASETDSQAAMEKTVRRLKAASPSYTWVGIYLLHGNELVLGPFEGKPSPHTRIPLGRGICGAAAAERQTIIVDDVSTDSRYLACSADTKSEIVVPIMEGSDVLGEIDVDSDHPSAFDQDDRALLEATAAMLGPKVKGVWRT
jgi:GAF domain-containing protein